MDPVVHTLEVAHNAGILHRDIKPGNIFVLNDGTVRLLDFGFAKFVRMRGLTMAGFVAGSPSYIAPEAWKGDPGLLDQRIDVYGLAVVMFRALTGKPPFVAGELVELLKMATTGKRPSLHKLAPRPAPKRSTTGWSKRSPSSPISASSRCAVCGWRCVSSAGASAAPLSA